MASFTQDVGADVQSDQGYLEHKEYLPVLELHLGDTGTTTDSKWAEHDIGELECYGDSKFELFAQQGADGELSKTL